LHPLTRKRVGKKFRNLLRKRFLKKANILFGGLKKGITFAAANEGMRW